MYPYELHGTGILHVESGQRGGRGGGEKMTLYEIDSAILAWARFDLSREILGGYWETRTA